MRGRASETLTRASEAAERASETLARASEAAERASETLARASETLARASETLARASGIGWWGSGVIGGWGSSGWLEGFCVWVRASEPIRTLDPVAGAVPV